jgi:hypothetical protein
MNPVVASLLSAALPALLQMLQSPDFQTIVKQIEADLLKKVNAGHAPVDANMQSLGKLGAAASLHLTGNPLADLQTALFGSTGGGGITFPAKM